MPQQPQANTTQKIVILFELQSKQCVFLQGLTMSATKENKITRCHEVTRADPDTHFKQRRTQDEMFVPRLRLNL